MCLTDFQSMIREKAKNGHFYEAEEIMLQSAFVLKKHGCSDDEVRSMLQKDFMQSSECAADIISKACQK
ncbi:MAG: hypothetical protein NC420_14375 [Eubacterium sp.]|nr:hypothetical protein [Eubacterium sp.]MCM1241047.1 hypothetical protein [Lachnospiraceae bacterium]